MATIEQIIWRVRGGLWRRRGTTWRSSASLIEIAILVAAVVLGTAWTLTRDKTPEQTARHTVGANQLIVIDGDTVRTKDRTVRLTGF